ncbi:helix-turn-helix domain-containing protein [Variovorax sp. tm]|uniref:helix-turn-helix domain-containing protein n=1 Tax=Variovorax atrisoli TaxID=3394203 RepID=UPI003A7FCEAC
MTNFPETFGQRLIKARSGHGWSQQELAEVSGVAAAQISRYESGRTSPRSEVAAKLAKALAVSFDWLLRGQGVPEVGAEIAMYPTGRHVYEVEVDDDVKQQIEQVAIAMGMTNEMAFRWLALQGLKMRASKLDVGDPAQDDLRRRIEALEIAVNGSEGRNTKGKR